MSEFSGSPSVASATSLIMRWQHIGLDISAHDYDVIADGIAGWLEEMTVDLVRSVKAALREARKKERERIINALKSNGYYEHGDVIPFIRALPEEGVGE